MNIEVLEDSESVARQAAAIIAQEARLSVSARGRFVMALSGDAASMLMLRELTREQIVWERLHVVQTDECVAPITASCRNLTRLRQGLLEYSLLRPQQIHAMPVEAAEIEVAAARYALSLQRIAGSPPVLDLVYLTLGADGRVAALLSGDPVLDVMNQDVTLTRIHEGRQWMTLTCPILNRARFVLWCVTGAEQAEVLVRLVEHDQSIPGGRIRGATALILADRPAAAHVETGNRAIT